jgi:hypothetical protein
MASSPLIFEAMPPPAARRRPAQFTLPSVLNVEKRLAECPLLADFVAESAYRRRGTAGAFFLKPSIVTRWIVRATYARLY